MQHCIFMHSLTKQINFFDVSIIDKNLKVEQNKTKLPYANSKLSCQDTQNSHISNDCFKKNILLWRLQSSLSLLAIGLYCFAILNNNSTLYGHLLHFIILMYAASKPLQHQFKNVESVYGDCIIFFTATILYSSIAMYYNQQELNITIYIAFAMAVVSDGLAFFRIQKFDLKIAVMIIVNIILIFITLVYRLILYILQEKSLIIIDSFACLACICCREIIHYLGVYLCK